jgi:Skp family chaperone for outer membrane proteins
VIDDQTAIGSTAEGKQALEDLQSHFASRQSELDGINKQIDDLRHRLEGGQTLGQVEELQQLRQQGQHLVGQRGLRNKELNEDLQPAQAEVAGRIGGKRWVCWSVILGKTVMLLFSIILLPVQIRRLFT